MALGEKAIGKGWDSGAVVKLYKALGEFLKDCREEVIADKDNFALVMALGNKAIGKGWDSGAVVKLYKALGEFSRQAGGVLFKGDNFSNTLQFTTERDFQTVAAILQCFKALSGGFGYVLEFVENEQINRLAVKQKLTEFLKGAEINLENMEKLVDVPAEFLREAGILDKVRILLKKVIPDLPGETVYYNEGSFIKSAVKLIGYWEKLKQDRNIEYLFKMLKQYGSIEEYYRQSKEGVLKKLKEAGFNVEYLLSGEEILKRGSNGNIEDVKGDKNQSWEEDLKQLLGRIIGSKGKQPEAGFKFNAKPGKLFQAVREDYSKAQQGDQAAGKAVIRRLLESIAQELGEIRNTENTNWRRLEEWHDLLSGLLGKMESGGKGMAVQGITAQRSRKLLPEILFDNERLACCIFKPRGASNDEISLLVLDPKTPLLEIWLEGFDEFMGVATEYLGTNKDKQPTMFIDTFEGSHILYDMEGRNFTLGFVLDAMVMDAYKMGAKELALYKCPYGKPREFINFVKKQAGKNGNRELITEVKGYNFTAVDIEDDGLADSQGDKHHYTDAYGGNKKLIGKKNCWVIDVEKYMEHRLAEEKKKISYK